MEPRAVLVSLEGQQEAGYFPGLPGSQHSQSGSSHLGGLGKVTQTLCLSLPICEQGALLSSLPTKWAKIKRRDQCLAGSLPPALLSGCGQGFGS